jgi:hypothetical protein
VQQVSEIINSQAIRSTEMRTRKKSSARRS